MLADGCFDPLHVGHLRYLGEAARLGSLIVRIAPDADIVAKGRKPFQTREERALMVAGLRNVSKVRCDGTLALAVLSECPQFLVKGHVMEACDQTETEIVFIESHERRSTERLS